MKKKVMEKKEEDWVRKLDKELRKHLRAADVEDWPVTLVSTVLTAISLSRIASHLTDSTLDGKGG